METPILPLGFRRDEDIALDLMRFIAMTPATACLTACLDTKPL